MCLPLSAIAYLIAWQQLCVWMLLAYFCILIGFVIGALLSGRKFRCSIFGVLRLLLCFLLDCIGMLSLAIPYFGNVFDILWAPLSAILVLALFQKASYGLLMFLKEALIISDIIPLATLFALESLLK